MTDLIRVLPDSVANQIAAGEVIQRPASLVKELMENAVDAGASLIQVIIKDAGRTLVQVVDNGCGMSESDARLCFERHATSKITQANDLFSIRTMGFRGEALASIAAVAQVELRTRQAEEQTGTRVVINGSQFEKQEPIAAEAGTNLSVKNLFYNVPARRKFLKTNTTEFRHILTEFQRIALAQPQIQFRLFHQDTEVFHLQTSGLRERISALFGKSMNQNTVSVKSETTLMHVRGFIGKPEHARKSFGEQFFFVNNRFMKHPYFHKAVMQCYDRLIPGDALPAYFLFLDIDPNRIDVNIHPTKTEIKFEDEPALYQILQATIRESLGKFNIAPSLDFNTDGSFEIPTGSRPTPVRIPEIEIDPDYNPFDVDKSIPGRDSKRTTSPSPVGWEKLYQESHTSEDQELPMQKWDPAQYLQIKNTYILTPVKSGIMLIHQSRAYERILYEEFMEETRMPGLVGQKSLFPVTLELGSVDYKMMEELLPTLQEFGFELEPFGGQSVIIRAFPEMLADLDPRSVIERFIEELRAETPDLKSHLMEKMAAKMARVASQFHQKPLAEEEQRFLVDRLFACNQPQQTPNGKPVLTILQMNEIEKRFS